MQCPEHGVGGGNGDYTLGHGGGKEVRWGLQGVPEVEDSGKMSYRGLGGGDGGTQGASGGGSECCLQK